MRRLFINYRRQDSEGHVGRLYDHLVQHFDPAGVFMDVDSIEPGADFLKTLQDAVAAADVLLAVIGPSWLTVADEKGERRIDQWDDFVRIEIAAAIQQGKLIIPILVGGATMPASSALPEDIAALSYRNAVTLTHQRFGADAAQLVEAIKAAVPAEASLKGRSDPEVVRQKEDMLKAVRDDLVNASQSPLYAFRTSSGYFPVPGEGNADANILFLGESPGKNEAEQGRPFVGPSGEILEEMLNTIGIHRADVYITNLLLDRPPDNHEPLPEELDFYAPFVDRILDIVQPAVIGTLGKFATQYILGKLGLPEANAKMKDVHGKLLKASMPYGEVHVIPMLHPASITYSPSQKSILRQDFQKLKLFV